MGVFDRIKMGVFDRIKRDIFGTPVPVRNLIGYLLGANFDDICKVGYVPLSENPEIVTACRRIAQLIGSMTIYLMSNTKDGDVRIINELSNKVDIYPIETMTRSHWIETIVMNMLLYGDGNSIVIPHTHEGYLQSLEPISASRVSFIGVGDGYRSYRVQIDGVNKNPNNLLHFVYNPDPTYLWKGRGISVYLRDLARNLKQAQETENGFMSSQWKPSLIVKVDAMIDEFSTKEGREKILTDYAQSASAGQPWLIPGEQFQVEQVKPLTLSDLAIRDTVELDKRTVASIIGVPAFLLGVGEYKQSEWNNFVQNTIRPITLEIQQELTRKIILNPKWYFKFNTLSLYDWDMQTVGNVLGSLYDRGVVTGNEVRDRLGYDPREGLDELLVLENYIPVSQSGKQKKVIQEGE